MRRLVRKREDIYFAFVATALMLITGYPIQLFMFAGSSGGENPPESKPIHIWDFDIVEDNKNTYKAETDVYTVKFPKKMDGTSAEITTAKGDHKLTISVQDLYCNSFEDMGNSKVFEKPDYVKGKVNGTNIVYSDLYTNISLKYDICFYQCKETFIIKSMPEGIKDDLIFKTTVDFDVGELSVFIAGKPISKAYDGKGYDIEFRDKEGNLVYRIPAPVAFDSPDKRWFDPEGKNITDSSTVNYDDCRYQITPSNDGVVLKYYLSYDFLLDKNTKFPVYLDPAVTPTEIYESITYEGWFNNTIKRTDSSGTTYLAGNELWLESSMNIWEGGVLTLNNITFRVNCTRDGEFSINVQGGELNLVNNTSISNGTTNN